MGRDETIIYHALQGIKDARGFTFEELATVCRAFENIQAYLMTENGKAKLVSDGLLRKE